MMTCLCHFPFSPWAVWSCRQPVSTGFGWGVEAGARLGKELTWEFLPVAQGCALAQKLCK